MKKKKCIQLEKLFLSIFNFDDLSRLMMKDESKSQKKVKADNGTEKSYLNAQ